jgi:hypothetical protein
MHARKERLDVAAGEDTSHILSGLTNQLPDRDPEETAEWVESLDSLIREQGTERAQYIMRSLLQRAGAQSVGVPMVTTTDYVNTIPADQEAEFPGNEEYERRYRAYMRWNAAVMVHRSQRPNIGVGGHISTYAGAATLYEVGFNHSGPKPQKGELRWKCSQSPSGDPAASSAAWSLMSGRIDFRHPRPLLFFVTSTNMRRFRPEGAGSLDPTQVRRPAR